MLGIGKPALVGAAVTIGILWAWKKFAATSYPL